MIAAEIHAMPTDETRPSHDAASAAPNDRTYALFNHIVGLVSVFTGGIPLGGLIATLIMWRIRAKDSSFLDDHGREAVNFQLSLLVYSIGGAIAVGIITAITLGLGVFLFPLGALALFALNLVGCIRGAIAANNGEFYRYPMNIRFIADPR